MKTVESTPQLPVFPQSVLDPKRRGRARTRVLAFLVVAALVAAFFVLDPLGSEAEAGSYQTATVGLQSVTAAYDGVAIIEPVTQALVGFPVDGSVSDVSVQVGDVVDVGDVLATLDTESLEENLRAQEAALAQAQLALSIALDGDDPSTTLAGGVVGASATGTPEIVLAVYTPTQSARIQLASTRSDDVATAQQAVLSAQQAVSEATAEAATALESAAMICAAVDTTTIVACQDALTLVTQAQAAVTDAQTALSAAASDLDALLEQWSRELEDDSTTTTTTPEEPAPDTTTETPDTTVPTPTTPGTSDTMPEAPDATPAAPSGGSGGSRPGGTVESDPPSAEDLIAYQSAVDAAALDVEVAEQALAQATIVSPISGTVVAVDLAPGDEVTSSSNDQTIVIEGEGGYEATVLVSIKDISQIAVGQTASLTPDGQADALSGEVVGVSAVPATTSTSSYRVTVSLGDAEVRNGNVGDLSIETARSDSVLAVPISAVTLDGTRHTVTVLDADEVARVTEVTIGAVGGYWVEISGGDLAEGDRVVIADLDQPLPGSATDTGQSSSNGTQSGGGFQPPGGMPGAPFGTSA